MARRRRIDTDPNSVLTERQHPDGRRRLSLTNVERQTLQRQQRAEQAAALFLDLQANRTYAEIAEEMGVSVGALKDLTKTAEFNRAYNALFVDVGHDPRFRAAKVHLGDMLPLAVRELKNLLTRPDTPSGTRMKAIEKVFALNGLNDPEPQHSDRQELVKFLVEHRVNLTDVGLHVPEEYTAYYEDVVDGEVREVPELPESTD